VKREFIVSAFASCMPKSTFARSSPEVRTRSNAHAVSHRFAAVNALVGPPAVDIASLDNAPHGGLGSGLHLR
jgi:hypothetical protein